MMIELICMFAMVLPCMKPGDVQAGDVELVYDAEQRTLDVVGVGDLSIQEIDFGPSDRYVQGEAIVHHGLDGAMFLVVYGDNGEWLAGDLQLTTPELPQTDLAQECPGGSCSCEYNGNQASACCPEGYKPSCICGAHGSTGKCIELKQSTGAPPAFDW